MKVRIAVVCLALVLLLSGLAGCSESLPEVYVQSVAVLTGYGSIGGFNASAGVVVAQDEIRVERDQSREIESLLVTVGQNVSAGDVLFTYDAENVQLEVDRMELEIEQMNNNIKDIDANIATLEKEKKAANKDDQLQYTIQIQALQTDKKEIQYNITVKQRELNTLLAESKDLQVVAPADGKIQEINESGTDNMGNAKPYITIMQSGAYRVKGKINELNRNDISVGANVLIRSRTDAQQTWTGVVSMIDTENPSGGNDYVFMPMDDTVSSSSYTFYVELSSNTGLILGQHVYIEPTGLTSSAATMRLDASFLQGNVEDGFWVWAEKDGKLEKRAVTAENYDGMTDTYEITEGLLPEDYIAFPEKGLQAGSPTTHNAPSAEEPDLPDDGFAEDDYVDNGFAEDESIAGDDVFFPEGDAFFPAELPDELIDESADGGDSDAA